MVKVGRIEIWNLTPDTHVFVGAQSVFNIVGRIKSFQKTEQLFYSLNHQIAREVHCNQNDLRAGRLERKGDFNVDTLHRAELKLHNHIKFVLQQAGKVLEKCEFVFHVSELSENEPNLNLLLERCEQIEQIGQIVDGKWEIGRSRKGEKYIEISEENAGMDRIILFGRDTWKNNYEITSRLCVCQITNGPHNVGLVFKWNPHELGDGTFLPTTWSTGLGYFCSYSTGLRLRYGVKVCKNSGGGISGNYVMQEAALSKWRLKYGNLINRSLKKLVPEFPPFSQIVTGVEYYYKLLITSTKYTLTVWKVGKKEPSPQLVVDNPTERISNGSVGVLALNCSLKIYEFKVAFI